MFRNLSHFFAILAIALFSIPTILAACNCAPGIPCVTGLFGSTSCGLIPCALGTYSPGGTSVCQVCPAGNRLVGASLLGTGATGCVPCAPGSFATLPGSSVCALASPGFFVPNSGAVLETACAPGSYQNLIGQTSCPLCPCGSYQPLPAQIICLPCGRITVPLTNINLIGSSPRGSTSPTQCSLCPGGSSTSSDPLADPSLYNPFAINLVYTNQCCGACPANTISQAGSPTCTVCQAGTAPNAARTSCTALSTARVKKRQIRCGPGFRSCPIPGNKKGLTECVDITNSLETCGGCPGEASFQDCSTLDNVASAQCIQGKCVTECPRGFNQTELGCVKASSPRTPSKKRSVAGRHAVKINRSI